MRLTRTITDTNRDVLMAALKAAPVGATFELVDDPRTLAQNKLMWALLNEVSAQLTIGIDRPWAEWMGASVFAAVRTMLVRRRVSRMGVSIAVLYQA